MSHFSVPLQCFRYVFLSYLYCFLTFEMFCRLYMTLLFKDRISRQALLQSNLPAETTSCSFGNSLTLLERGTCGSISPRAPDDCFFLFGGGGLQWIFQFRLSSEGRGHFNRSSKETVLEIVLSESDIGIELEVAELQATELELSSATLSLLPLT